jgi:hypothetical protein
MQMKHVPTLFAAVLMVAVLAPNLASAEGWFVKTFYHKATTAECMKTAVAAFKGIAGTLQRGNQVVYGYDLRGKNPYDALIICQRPTGTKKEDVSDIAVVFVLFDRFYSKKSKIISRKLKDRISKRYKEIAKKSFEKE